MMQFRSQDGVMEKDGALSRHAFKQPHVEGALFAVIYTGFLT